MVQGPQIFNNIPGKLTQNLDFELGSVHVLYCIETRAETEVNFLHMRYDPDARDKKEVDFVAQKSVQWMETQKDMTKVSTYVRLPDDDDIVRIQRV